MKKTTREWVKKAEGDYVLAQQGSRSKVTAMPTLLVVDDNPLILGMLRSIFCEPEVTLLTAETATEALELARERRPDVVLLDIYLPDLSGQEVFVRLRQLHAAT